MTEPRRIPGVPISRDTTPASGPAAVAWSAVPRSGGVGLAL